MKLEELVKLKELSELIVESIRQFARTKEELMRTTLQVQIELLSTRLKRLKVSIEEIKGQMDEVCIPKEARAIEEVIGVSLKPYVGASIDSNNDVQDFSWKSKKTLEEEKSKILGKVSNNSFQKKINQIYNFYVDLSNNLYQKSEEKSRLK